MLWLNRNRLVDESQLPLVLDLKLDHLALLSLVTAKLEVLAALDRLHRDVLLLVLAVRGFHLQDNLLGGLGLLVEDRLGLTTITGLLSVVTSTTLAERRLLALLVLSHLEVLVLARRRAVRFSCLWYVYHLVCSNTLKYCCLSSVSST